MLIGLAQYFTCSGVPAGASWEAVLHLFPSTIRAKDGNRALSANRRCAARQNGRIAAIPADRI